MMSEVDWKFYQDQVDSDQCACGRTKKMGFPFCVKCYRSLPEYLQEDCAFGMHKGLPEAYEAAAKFLDT